MYHRRRQQVTFEEGQTVLVDLSGCAPDRKPKWHAQFILGKIRYQIKGLKNWWMIRLQTGDEFMFSTEEFNPSGGKFKLMGKVKETKSAQQRQDEVENDPSKIRRFGI